MAVLDFSKPHLLRSEEEYEAALVEIEELLTRDAAPNSEDGERLEFLALLVDVYEDVHYPMGSTTTPQAVVDFMLDQRGMSRDDLAGIMGGSSRVSDFFKGEHELSRAQIKALRDLLGIRADLLI